jgi:hypothetical protein
LSLALKLFVNLVGHPEAASTYRVSKAFQPAIAIHRQATTELEEAGINILPRVALRAKAKEFVEKQLCAGETIMNLSNVDLLSGILDPGLPISLPGRIYDLLKMEPIESRAILGKQSGMSRPQALYIDRVISVFLGLTGGNQNSCRGAVTIATAVKKTQWPGDNRSAHYLFQGYTVVEMSFGTKTAVVMVLNRNLANDTFAFLRA